jgi:predicted AAA+ superfamily ATPase
MATTNRRNLVRESFADRGLPGEEMQALDIHGRDTMQEKVSLAARFGLRVTFAAPNQETYLSIATALARGRGLPLSDEEVRARALLWERQHLGRSGRTARQFVDELQAGPMSPSP